MPWLINADQFNKFRRSQKNILILDASLHMPDAHRDAKQEFAEKHILGASFFDIDHFSDTHSTLPHMLIQDETVINSKLSALGIRNDCKIIFYDNSDLHSACRALWMFKVFGHNPHLLYILDGGLAAWENFGGKTESGTSSSSPKIYQSRLQLQHLKTLGQMKENLHHPHQQVIDLRHPIRFAGGPEIRPNMRSGHIPGSFSLPYYILFEKTGCFKPLNKIKQILLSQNINLSIPMIATCGSAITAPILDFILDILQHKEHSVYDGSWTEWGSLTLYPNETSLDERPVEDCLMEGPIPTQ